MGTYEFEQLARLESKNRGLADLPLALIPHPLGGIREDEVMKKAELVVEVVRKAVTRG
jgi:predicted dienelactone hydrolase